MVASETLDLFGSQCGVIAASSFCNIVKQRRHIKQPVAIKASGQSTGERVLLCVFWHREATQIAQHR